MFICTATVHHGDTRLTATGRGDSRGGALLDAILSTDVGYRASPANADSALEALEIYDRGDARAPGKPLPVGHVYLEVDDDGYPVINIGWVTYTFTCEQPVRLWAVTAQVRINLEREGWSGSRQVPTFYLDPTVQGITGPEGARAVAEDILYTVAGDTEGVQLHVTVEPIY